MKQEEALRMARTAASAGNVSPSLATGTIKETDVNAVFGEAVQGSNFGLLAHNFQNGRYVNSYAAQQLQSPISNSVGIGVTAGFEQAYTQWQALHRANPAAAVAYYGDHAAKMEGYDKAIRGGETELAAYAQTFGRGPDLDKVPMPDGVKMKDAHAAVQEAITAQDAGWISSGRTKLSPSASNVVAGWLMAKAGAYARASGVSIDQAASKLYAAGLASGEIERAGPFAWTNPQGAKKLGSYLGLPDDTTDRLVTSTVGDKLKRAGFPQGTGGSDYVVLRVDGGSGQPALYIQALHPDHGGHTDVLLTMPELRAANRRVIEAGMNKEAARQQAAKPVAIDVSSEGVAARRNSYQHAMDQDGPTIDIGPPIGDALYGALDIVGTSKKTGDLIIGGVGSAVHGAVNTMRRQFNNTLPKRSRNTE